MQEIEYLTTAEIVLDKKGNVISKKIEAQKVPLTKQLALNFIKALGWDLEKNQPITWK